jgi:hypothetical protein
MREPSLMFARMMSCNHPQKTLPVTCTHAVWLGALRDHAQLILCVVLPRSGWPMSRSLCIPCEWSDAADVIKKACENGMAA